MAEFIDNEELNGSEFSSIEEVTAKPEVKAEVQAPELPEKYRGKKLEDIVQMHQEAEKLIGKQAQEVGEVRRLADELLRQQLSVKDKPPTKEEDEEVDFFVDPKAAVKKAVETHPDVVSAREAAAAAAAERAHKTLREKHADVDEVVRDPEFIEWVKASKVRVALFVAADQNRDLDAADELLSTYKVIKGSRQATAAPTNTVTKEDAEAMRQSSLKSASVDASGTGEQSKKFYRRTDLIRLKMEDPDRYNAMQDEIMRAYAEKRVR